MKNLFKIILAVIAMIAGFQVGRFLGKFTAKMFPLEEPVHRESVIDTVYDTIPYIAPAPVSSLQIGYKGVKMPKSGNVAAKDSSSFRQADTAFVADVIQGDDSVELQLPVVQNVYEGKDYKAYVSGVEARLDSMFVYPRREIVTIKKPPKRWHIGPAVGYGYTGHGVGPFVGVSVTYSIVSW